MRLANRRIRLRPRRLRLRLRGACSCAPPGSRACRPASYERLAAGQHRATIVDPGGRGAIFDRTGVQLAIGEQATTVYANPRQIRDPQPRGAARRARPRLDPQELQPALADRSHGFVYVARKADPERVQRMLKKAGIVRASASSTRSSASIPLNHVASQVVGYAGTDNHGLAGPRARARQTSSPASRASETVDPRPVGPRDRRPQLDAGARGPERHAHDRPHDPGPGRERAPHDDRPVARAGGVGDRARPAHRRASSRWPSSAATTRTASRSCPKDRQRNRDRDRHVRAGLDVQDRDGQRPRSPKGSSRRGRRSRFPYEIHVADRVINDAAPARHRAADGRPDPRRTRRTSARSRWPRSSARRGSRTGSAASGSATRPGIDFPGETPGIVLPLDQWSGSTIGNAADRPRDRGHADADGGGLRRRSPTTASGCSRTSSTGSASTGSPARRSRGGSSRAASRARCVKMMEDVVIEGTGQEAAAPGLQGRRQDRAPRPKPDPSGGYSNTKYVASFVGFVPATQPAPRILVTVDEPHDGDLGRRRRGTGVPADRQVRPAVPRDSAGRAADGDPRRFAGTVTGATASSRRRIYRGDPECVTERRRQCCK